MENKAWAAEPANSRSLLSFNRKCVFLRLEKISWWCWCNATRIRKVAINPAGFFNAFLKYDGMATFQSFIGSSWKNGGIQGIDLCESTWIHKRRWPNFRGVPWLNMLESGRVFSCYRCVVAQSVDWLLPASVDCRFSDRGAARKFFGNQTLSTPHNRLRWI